MKRTYETIVTTHDTTNPEVESNCADITFFNNTSGTVFINQFPVAVGATLSIASTSPDDFNVTKYRISFNAATGQVIVMKKIYK